MIRKILTNFIIPAIAAIMLIFTFISINKNKEEPAREVVVVPPTANFKHKIAGLGIVEPETKIINIGVNIPGVLNKIYVSEGQYVKKNTPLFSIDNRDIVAQLAQAKANLKISVVNYKDLEHSLNLYEQIKDKRAVSANELSRKRYAVEKARAELAEATAHLEIVKTNLDRSIVKSPIDGHILKINARIGEFIEHGSTNPPLILGNLNKMQVRVAIDETDIHRIDEDASAVGILRSYSEVKIPLNFVKYEPYVIPKINLSNNVAEKIDTRVLELIYKFDNSRIGAIPGQQMDVFIHETKE